MIRLGKSFGNCTKDLARVLALFDSYRAAPGGDALKKLLDAIESRNKRIDALYDARNRMRRLTGWPELPVFADAPKSLLMTNGRGAAAIEAPLLWDVKLLREKGVPGAGADTVEPREKTK